MKRYYFYSFLISLISLGVWSCNSDEMIEDVSLSTKFVVNDSFSVHEQVKNLYDSFTADTKSTRTESVEFPDYFGSSFVNEKAELAILVKEIPKHYKDKFFQMENGLAKASGYEINNLLDYILTGPKGTYFCINNYISLGAEGTTTTNFNITLQGKSFFISSFQYVNTNSSG
ncbi:MAG: hypothetical protein SOR57_01360 [Parabacteroides sp.]|nr:hypothetical protein [Parabacteroides sp.]